MKNCQNCGYNQEVCGETSCHSPKMTPELIAKVLAGEECVEWKPGLAVLEKAWENARKTLQCPPRFKCKSMFSCSQCRMDYALQKAIEG